MAVKATSITNARAQFRFDEVPQKRFAAPALQRAA